MAEAIQGDEVLQGLIESGLRFVERSVAELEDEPDFSVAHFATGLELILKARLFSEHWSLIAAKPHDAAWNDLRSGSAMTLQASLLCKAVSKVTGERLDRQDAAFGRAFAHRNRVLHFLMHANRDEVAAEQLIAWWHLHRLITGAWKPVFEPFLTRIRHIDQKLLHSARYLNVRYDEHRKSLEEMEKGGRVTTCPVCGYAAGKLRAHNRLVSEFECVVCTVALVVAKFPCGKWRSLEDGAGEDLCDCGDHHSLEGLAGVIDPMPNLRPKEQMIYEPNRAFCAECLHEEALVVPIETRGLACLFCGQLYSYEDVSQCDSCSDSWAGASLEASHFLGCERCEGAVDDRS